jgi:hypothetical protein
MIDLGIGELDQSILDGIARVLEGAKSPGWIAGDRNRVTLDAPLWSHLTDLIIADPSEPVEGLTFLSAALVAERLGAALTAIPLADHIVAMRLADFLHDDAFADLRASKEPVGLLVHAEQSRAQHPPICMGGAIARWIVRIGEDEAAILRQDDSEMGVAAPNLADLPASVVKAPGNRWIVRKGPAVAQACALARGERKVLTASIVAGLCEKAVSLASQYAKERQLFGGPIGGFQSLAHSLSSAKVLGDGVELLAREAAWARDGEPESFDRLSRMAYAFAASSGDQATRTAVHIFGGYGVTREFPVQAYFRMARALCLLVGDRRIELQTIGRRFLAG